ncbi:hypothetical protein [Aliarcobacter butzleri]|uniref:hypothetical protein n=1 Tax=Aliarcobacter butzleri TaxID=28197 RepID=UPI0006584A15|nr:hypothetical protein [Aliarcobacter butzleri]KLE04209.1 hypothetical protein AF78_08970 [Aliarcobacter butzleri L353]MCT7566876.1 hypothetical protein [Aliarcobacter butzleri]MCT7575281.1 hypothetical protein [Aliarcobacter butzleri]MCT7611736.1 hypothetical protein [Aliarcobacter butzleri]MCT7640269.1 hypothetical protein [Aliarcobacter butzleri]
MKKTVSLVLLGIVVFGFSGCVKENQVLNTPTSSTNIIKRNVVKVEEVPLPYVKESKFIKILILPFENAENDIDYGGYIETKLESSKFIFSDSLKKKIIEEDTIGGI